MYEKKCHIIHSILDYINYVNTVLIYHAFSIDCEVKHIYL